MEEEKSEKKSIQCRKPISGALMFLAEDLTGQVEKIREGAIGESYGRGVMSTTTLKALPIVNAKSISLCFNKV